MDDDGIGALIAFAIGIAIVLFIIYCIIAIAGIIAMVAGAGGVLWGGGTAVVNYGQSLKENIIDSNRATAGAAA